MKCAYGGPYDTNNANEDSGKLGFGQRNLFRTDSITASREGEFGLVLPGMPVSWTILSSSLVLVLGLLIYALSTGTYSRRVISLGVVRGVGGDVRVMAPISGTIAKAMVTEGQQIKAGQPLFLIATTKRALSGDLSDAVALRHLAYEASSLEKQLSALEKAGVVLRSTGPVRIRALKVELAAAVAQERAGLQRLSLARESLTKLEPVAAKGFISGESLRRRREEVLTLEQAVTDARALQSRYIGQISEVTAEIANLPNRTAQEREQIGTALSRSQRERDSLIVQRGFALPAPVSGVVSSVQFAVGQQIDNQRILLTISVPSKALSAEIFVPSRAVGFLKTGQRVRLRYDAFPYQRFGVAFGTIRTVASTVLRPSDVDAPVRVEEPVYRVIVDLDRKYLEAYGRRYDLRSGLALQADIMLERRTIMEWMLDPILALRGRI